MKAVFYLWGVFDKQTGELQCVFQSEEGANKEVAKFGGEYYHVDKVKVWE